MNGAAAACYRRAGANPRPADLRYDAGQVCDRIVQCRGVHPYDMGMILDKLGIAVRTGQHCAEPVMTHYGVTGMCRASFAMYNTLAEADALVAGVERAVKMLK